MQVLSQAFDLSAWRSSSSYEDNSEKRICEEIFYFIGKNFNRRITLADISTYVGYSPRYLNLLFRKHFNSSIINHLIQLRLHKAYEMLKTKPFCTVKEACYSVGFSNPAYFTRTFKKAFGKLPHEVGKETEFKPFTRSR
jgi:two-component system response regulator YesN